MTIIIGIIFAVGLIYAGAWVRVSFISGINLGCKQTYSPKYGLPFVWVVHVIPDAKFPKLSSGCGSNYEINVLTAKTSTVDSSTERQKVITVLPYGKNIVMGIKILFNAIALLVAMFILFCFIFARGSDINATNFIGIGVIFLICCISIFLSHSAYGHSLFVSTVPAIIVFVIFVLFFVDPYIFTRQSAFNPGYPVEVGVQVITEMVSTRLGTKGYKTRADIEKFRAKFPALYECTEKRASVIENYITKNEERNALVEIEFSRTDFWAIPLGKVKDGVLFTYSEPNEDLLKKLRGCHDQTGKSILSIYGIKEDQDKNGYADYDTDMYDAFRLDPNALGYRSDRNQNRYFQLFGSAASPEVVKSINTQLLNYGLNTKICSKYVGMSSIDSLKNLLSIVATEEGNCDKPDNRIPEYRIGLVFDLETGRQLLFADLFTDYTKDSKAIKEIIKSKFQQNSYPPNSVCQINHTKYVDTILAGNDLLFSFYIGNDYVYILPLPSQELQDCSRSERVFPLSAFKEYLKPSLAAQVI